MVMIFLFNVKFEKYFCMLKIFQCLVRYYTYLLVIIILYLFVICWNFKYSQKVLTWIILNNNIFSLSHKYIINIIFCCAFVIILAIISSCNLMNVIYLSLRLHLLTQLGSATLILHSTYPSPFIHICLPFFFFGLSLHFSFFLHIHTITASFSLLYSLLPNSL